MRLSSYGTRQCEQRTDLGAFVVARERILTALEERGLYP
jgi:hypothetical protein